jgi:hypothetical protein
MQIVGEERITSTKELRLGSCSISPFVVLHRVLTNLFYARVTSLVSTQVHMKHLQMGNVELMLMTIVFNGLASTIVMSIF